MFKYYILGLITMLTTSVLKANLLTSPADKTVRDSIGVENSNGKKTIVHQVVAKDTYYSIGRRYKVLPKVISDYNDNKFLQIGVIIKVPTEIPFEGAGKSGPVTGQVATNGASTSDSPAPELLEYTVQPKDNLHALAIKYSTTVDEIKKASNLRSINLSIGQVLKIPVKNAEPESNAATATNTSTAPNPAPIAAAREREREKTTVPAPATELKTVISPSAKTPEKTVKTAAAATTVPTEEFVEHIVGSNETMYSIASKHKMTVAQLMAKNKMNNSSLTVGQHLLIKGEWPPKEVFVASEDNDADSAEEMGSLKNPNLKYPSSRYGLNERDEKGTAVWITDQDMDASKMYVLHRTAPIGTVMKITNPMSNRTTFAKVVGKFTENESTKDVIVVMTKAVADSLGALDKRFFCNISYSGPEHEQ
jgi:peptidoglycan endopeptidase LytF